MQDIKFNHDYIAEMRRGELHPVARYQVSPLSNQPTTVCVLSPSQQQQPQPPQSPQQPQATTKQLTQEKTLNNLIEHLTNEEKIGLIKLDLTMMRELIQTRAPRLLTELEEGKDQLMNIGAMFASQLAMLMIRQDKTSGKLNDVYERLHEPFYYDNRTSYVRGYMNDYANVDRLNKLLSNRYRQSRETASSEDRVYMSYLCEKSRGRKKKSVVDELFDQIEQISVDHVTQMTYPLYRVLMSVINAGIPKQCNHGWFLENTINCIRKLDTGIWPAHSLMKVLNNLESCVQTREKIRVTYDETQKRYYCAFSGLPIRSGETVYCLKLVERDATRTREWRLHGDPRDQPWLNERYRRSVRTFFVKTELCCPSRLVYTDFPMEYKALYNDHFLQQQQQQQTTQTQTQPPMKKKKLAGGDGGGSGASVAGLAKTAVVAVTDSRLWPTMIGIYNTVGTLNMDEHLWHVHTKGGIKNYAQEKAQLYQLFEEATDETFSRDLVAVLYYYVISLDPRTLETREAQAFELHSLTIQALCDTLLDFIELLFVCPSADASNLSTAENVCLLRNLLTQITQRAKTISLLPPQHNRNAFLRETPSKCGAVRLFNVEAFNSYPFLFIIVFSFLYEKKRTLVEARYPNRADAAAQYSEYSFMLKKLNITINKNM